MNLDCLNDIITDGLAIQIDISDIDSWNLNTGFTSISLTQWCDAKSDNINLYDFGLTAYDNGRVDRMYDQLDLTPSDLKVELYRVGYNTGQTAYSGETQYDLYPISAVTTGSTVGNYFDIDGGYLQGFFKLNGYNHELFPQRYNEGITIETIIRIDEDSSGMLFLMGVRAEDKYNPEFSGESETIEVTTVSRVPSGVVGRTRTVVSTESGFTGVQTSEENYLNAYKEVEEVKDAFASWENMTHTTYVRAPQSGNTKSNVIAFSLTTDKKISYKYIDENNLVRTKLSNRQITATGWTVIDMVFIPDELIEDYDPSIALCYERRKGTLKFFVNGREFWKINNFDEFFFRGLANDKEKQLGVPYNISFGGGSFGLEHSWHYDFKTISLYSGETTEYINNNFSYKEYPNSETIDDLPYAFVNFNVEYSTPSVSFSIPNDPLGDIEFNYNGITLTNSGTTSSGNTEWDYSQSGRTVTFNPLTNMTGDSNVDVVTLTYLYDKLGTPTVGAIEYLVYKILPSEITSSGTTIQLPEDPSGDIQLSVDGISMTKGNENIVGDFIQDPNDSSVVIIQNASLALYLQSNPTTLVSYIVNTTTLTIEEYNETYEVYSLNTNKIYYSASNDKTVYRMDYSVNEVEDVKVTINGITLQPNTEYELNPNNKYELFFEPIINIGDVFGVYYLIDSSNNIGGIAFSGDSNTFSPDTVFRVDYVGVDGQVPSNQYYIEFDTIIDALSNRDLTLNVDIYDTGIFKNVDDDGNQVYSSISLTAFGTEEITVEKETIYTQPISTLNPDEEGPFSKYDGNIYQYEDEETRLLIDGQTGYPVISEYNSTLLDNDNSDFVQVSGREEWHELSKTFRLKDNTARQQIIVGLLIESTAALNDDFTFFIKDFYYTAADKLVQDETKDNLLIQQNFGPSYKGGIQKLRLYTRAFNSQEVLHNAKIELKNNPGYAYAVSGGGRIIYR